MYRLGIIEESLDDNKILEKYKEYIYSRRIEEIPDDEFPIWHIDEYRVPNEKMSELLSILKEHIKLTWYIHAFDENELIIIFKGKYFEISTEKDDSWNAMIEYGVNIAQVEGHFLENIPLKI
ncbi:hypothetical protein [Fusibacter ferrireducens]|uniref:Uncharacterized protein n=1 Tax=Fusibacter ferrireducens TaxID=2785058 RepID=A0ABR9ZNH0_9FIRM|nr:hypothetical protein [Fusibacter ferrireducens]MBF4692018.1 hypothetical protein [Fusibacter ferrireducens]